MQMTSSSGDRNFDVAFEELLVHEGGFVDHPNDPGGATKYGISLRWFRSAVSSAATVASIKALTPEKARALYHDHWWKRYKYDQLPEAIARKVFDTSVNMGAKRAHRLLQRAVWGACGKHNKIKDDGIIGPRTLKAVRNCDQGRLLASFRSEQAAYYRILIAKRPKFKVFELGWLRRAYA